MKRQYAAVTAICVMMATPLTACTPDSNPVAVCHTSAEGIKEVRFVDEPEAHAPSYSIDLTDCETLSRSDLPMIADDLASMSIVINEDGAYDAIVTAEATTSDTHPVTVIKDSEGNTVDSAGMIMFKVGSCFTGVELNDEGRLVLKSDAEKSNGFVAADTILLYLAPRCL